MTERKKKKDRDRDRINIKGIKNKGELRTSKDGTEKMAQRLITCTVLVEDWSLVPSTHQVTNSQL